MCPPKDTKQGSGERNKLWARARMEGKYPRMTCNGTSKRQQTGLRVLQCATVALLTLERLQSPGCSPWRFSVGELLESVQSSLWASTLSLPPFGSGWRSSSGGWTASAGLSPDVMIKRNFHKSKLNSKRQKQRFKKKKPAGELNSPYVPLLLLQILLPDNKTE